MRESLKKIIDTMVPNYKDVFGITDEELLITFDEFIKSMPAPIPKLFPVLLKFYNNYPLFFKFQRLENLDRAQRQKILEKWARSKLYVKRAMKTFLMLVFYSDEKVEKRLGFERKCLFTE